MRVLGFDTETTGVNAETDVIIEVGATLFDVTPGEEGFHTWEPLEGFSELVYEFSYPEVSPEIQRLTGIKPAELKEKGIPFLKVLTQIAGIACKADMILAHNKAFDRTILMSQIKRMGYENEREVRGFATVPWICSLVDVKFISDFKCKKLSHLALDLGLAVDPSTLHRAMDDVLLMGKLMERIPTSPQEILRYSQEPDCVIRAHIRAPWEDGGKGKEEASKLGYSWEVPRGATKRFEKAWVKKIKESEFDSEIQKASFPVKFIGRL